MNERLTNLEIKFTHQEATIEELNQLVFEQSKEITQLSKLLVSLKEQVKNLNEANSQKISNDAPPHY